MPNRLPDDFIALLATLEIPDALEELRARELLISPVAAELATFALTQAHDDPQLALQWLTLARGVQSASGNAPDVEATILYAEARLQVLNGELALAEQTLERARSYWQSAGDTISLARSGLGLTQILAMQDRLDEAEATILRTIADLESLALPDTTLLLLDARQNHATLLSYQERYQEALAIDEAIRAQLAELLAVEDEAQAHADLQQRLGLVLLDSAVALTYLDRPADAEAALREAISLLSQANAPVDRGRAQTNLGHLYNRTGRYADALQAFDGATYDLLGTLEVDRVPERWPVADVLFLEQAIAFLAVNLLPEAASTLERAEALFRQSAQRYELMQTLYYRALLALRLETAAAAQRTLSEAATLATAMDNVYWQNHIRLAQSLAMSQAGETAAARAALADLTAWQPPAGREGVLHWDAPLRAEAGLLALHEALEDGDINTARRHASEVASTLGLPPDGGAEDGAFPHLRARLLHGLGRIERAAGGTLQARTYLTRALDAVEAQRATLPLEEFRTAFLTDKSDMYADLVLALLDSPAPDEDTVASAFAVIERARSRTLLERLLVSLDEATLAAGAPSPELSERMAAVRQQLYWLYNRLLGDEPGSRHAIAELTAELNAHEGALRQLEWRAAPWLAQAEPVSLQALQAVLAGDQQALLYYLAGEELMAFVASRNEVQIVRQVATAGEIQRALSDLRFQMGRVEVGSDYVARHRQRLMNGVRSVLHQLYDLVWAPVAPLVEARRVLIAPYGPLHLLPFHALWDGQAYLLQHVELSYIPSASIEVHRRRRAKPSPYAALAGLALRDASIPQAEAEIQAAARYFRQATTYLDDAAGVVNLRRAAAEGDALHIATHGLFRPDNPFFSALKLADGWIDVHEIYRLPLRARLVVLSACESGAVQVQGSEEAIGLVRGFLGAGAESLVVSLWNVHDASAANLMERFYARLTDHAATPAAALRGAQIDTLSHEEHPYYWAPYIVIG